MFNSKEMMKAARVDLINEINSYNTMASAIGAEPINIGATMVVTSTKPNPFEGLPFDRRSDAVLALLKMGYREIVYNKYTKNDVILAICQVDPYDQCKGYIIK